MRATVLSFNAAADNWLTSAAACIITPHEPERFDTLAEVLRWGASLDAPERMPAGAVTTKRTGLTTWRAQSVTVRP